MIGLRFIFLCACTLVPLTCLHVSSPIAGPFTLQLRLEYSLEWEISADSVIHATMSTNATAWIGFGLSPSSFLTFHGMNHADIITASWSDAAGMGKCSVDDCFNDSNFEKEPKRDIDIGGSDDVVDFSCNVTDGFRSAS